MTKKKLLTLLNQHNIEFNDDGLTMEIITPDDKVFKTFNTRMEMVVYGYDGWKKSEVYEYFYNIAKEGLINENE